MKVSLNLQNNNQYSKQSFKALSTSGVWHPQSQKMVDEEIDRLEELGKKYEIELYSEVGNNGREFITACVAPLGKTPPPNYRNSYGIYTTFGRECRLTEHCNSVVDLVYGAIASLRHYR